MPQEFHALCCAECGTFQVHILKKVPKWTCKICQKKQSVLQEFGRGSGKDCRLHVQRLNKLRLEQDTLPLTAIASKDPAAGGDHPEFEDDFESQVGSEGLGSKWDKYLDEKEESAEEFQDLEPGSGDARAKRKRRTKQSVGSTKKMAWCGDEAASVEDVSEPCVNVERPTRSGDEAAAVEDVSKPCVDVERPRRSPEREWHSKQAQVGKTRVVTSKWAKYVDPADKDDTNTEGMLGTDFVEDNDHEEDLDELLKL